MSLIKVAIPAKVAAADASEIQRVEKLLKRKLTDAEFWKLGDYVMKHMKVGKTFTDNELLSAVKDSTAADADKSEELEREIKGDVVAVVSGNAARVSKDVSFATAKEGVESFARKNGVSVVASQEYGEAYKFKFSAAIDCATDAAQDYDPRYANPQAEEKFKAKIREYGKAHGGNIKGITNGDIIKWAKEIGCENYVVPWQDAIGYFRYGKGKGEFATDADDKIHYELKGLVKTLRAKGLQQDEISRKLNTYCREHDIPLSYLNRSIFDGCEGAAQDADDIIKYIQDDVRKTLQILRELNNASGKLKDAAITLKNITSGSGIRIEAKLIDKATRILAFAEKVERESGTLATSY